MKYYCKNCGAIMDSSGLGRNKYEMDKEPCPICSFGKVVKVSAHETVAQWEARTGKQYPDSAPVYTRVRKGGWYLYEAVQSTRAKAVVATEAGVPPDDWKPEEADFPQSEVVGNIHDDPDLLKKEY